MDSTKDLKFCFVCNYTKIIHGNSFCEACRSFYIRNNKRESLQCKRDNPSFKCLELDGKDESIVDFCILSKNGNRRLLCPGCRLAKCKKVLETRSKSPSTNSTNVTCSSDKILVKYPSESEAMLKIVIKASQDLTNQLDQLPCRSNNVPFTNAYDAFFEYVQTMDKQVLCIKRYANCFPFYRNFSVQDRVCHMLTSKQRLLVGENLTNPNDLYVGCLSTNFQNLVHQFMPPTLPSRKQAIVTKHRIDCMKWTKPELGFLLAFLCFDVSSDLLSNRGAENLVKGQQLLTNAYLSYLDQICIGNEQQKFTKAALMKSLIDDVTSETNWRIEFSQRTFLPNLYKVIDSRGRMVSTIFNGTAKQYNRENRNVEE